MKYIQSIISATAIGLFLILAISAVPVLPQQTVLAAPGDPPARGGGAGGGTVKDQVCDQLGELDDGSCGEDNKTILTGVVKPIMQTLIIVIGAVAVLVIVVGGLMYILSAGDANNTKRAKDAIMYAVIGLIVALFAQAIVTFVIGSVG